ncbi:MAG: Tat pathway signal protein [Chloroflexi bacterium]|nr:Tat pathway signal protein [Chloroflexota bacterium]
MMSNISQIPWYRRTYRWGQTNITEIDPTRYDIQWWRQHWRRTRVQGVIINAGGIVAYYPSKHPLQYRALLLGERDLYGELVAAAREEGLAVLARMDCNRADERFYLERPEWFTLDAEGRPYRQGDLYVTCIHSAYYDEHIPAIVREIIERSHPDGFADNSWSGLPRQSICYCQNCRRKFRDATGLDLPKAADWNSNAYRQWIAWNYARRVEVWDLFNRTTKEAGGSDCLYLGMIGGEIIDQCYRFRDLKAIAERAEVIMLDFQARTSARGFQSNGHAGELLHGLLGWDKLIAESTALYQHGQPAFRMASKPEPEVRMWAVEGFAGGLQPWWHHISAYHEDRRQYRTAEPIFRWHEANEQYLVNRQPVASVGVVWSQANVDFYGQDDAEDRVGLPQRGVTNALIRARTPYIPVHADHVEREAGNLTALVLPNIGALSDSQCQSIRRFVERGGGLVATGETSLYDEWGDRRGDFALADLFGAHATGAHHGSRGSADPSWETYGRHSYLRLSPELRARVYGPLTGTEPQPKAGRHPALRGFDDTDIILFGGRLEVVRPEAGAQVPLTFIPPFPIYPPETSWMRYPKTDLPALVLNEPGESGRVAYLPADIDRCFGRDNWPDHADLLANLVRWAGGDRIPLRVEGPGFVDCHLYQQGARLVLHLVNLTSAGTWRAPVHELVPVGPLRVRIQLPADVAGGSVRLLVSGSTVAPKIEAGWVGFEVPSISDHEVAVLE